MTNIRDEILSPNRYLLAHKDECLNDVLARLKAADGKNWWHLVVDWSNGEFRAIKFEALAQQLAQASEKVLEPLTNFNLQPAKAMEKSSMGTATARDLARRQPNSLLVVTQAGMVIGIINEGLRRSDPDTREIVKYHITVNVGDINHMSGGQIIIGGRDIHQSIQEQINKGSPAAENDEKPVGDEGDTVHFSAYYPHQAQIGARLALIIYAHLQAELADIGIDAQRFKDQLGGEVPSPKTAKQSKQLKLGTAITIVPESDEIEFQPASLTKQWDGMWTRFDFDFTPGAALPGEILMVRVSVQISGVEIAHINCLISAEQQGIHAQPALVSQPTNALAAAKLSTQTAKLYQKIFISYSREDKEVVESYGRAQLALGNEVFTDTTSIRAGENWQAAMARAIDNADILQLFWSEKSAASSNVREEWHYALHYRCPDTRGEGFIRPVYWVEPIPVPPPEELKHLNFKYVPLKPYPADQNRNE